MNDPPVGLVTPETDRDAGRKTFAHDPHLDPQLSWAGKAEHTWFEVPAVSLHVHEHIYPCTIIEAVRKQRGADPQPSLFAILGEDPPLRQAIESLEHRYNWSSRLVAGDRLLEKESLGGQVQTVYIDPPCGIHYGSNFQPFVGRRKIVDGEYQLPYPSEGVGTKFVYRSVPKVSLQTLGYGEPSYETVLYDQPHIDRAKARVTGPFKVEAVPALVVRPLGHIETSEPLPADDSVTRAGPTVQKGDRRDEPLKAGIRGTAWQQISFARLERLPGTRWLHAVGETRLDDTGATGFSGPATAYDAVRVMVSFGPDDAPLEQRQVSRAVEETQLLAPKSRVTFFAAFQFDPDAAEDIDESHGPDVTLLNAQMKANLLTDDLKKKRAGKESFQPNGQPGVAAERATEGDNNGRFRVLVRGFDYFNTWTGNADSGGGNRTALWMLDPDHDGRSLLPRQVFLSMAGARNGWVRLAKNLKAEIDTDLSEAYRGTVCLPFESGEHRRAAVDDRGVESLMVLELV